MDLYVAFRALHLGLCPRIYQEDAAALEIGRVPRDQRCVARERNGRNLHIELRHSPSPRSLPSGNSGIRTCRIPVERQNASRKILPENCFGTSQQPGVTLSPGQQFHAIQDFRDRHRGHEKFTGELLLRPPAQDHIMLILDTNVISETMLPTPSNSGTAVSRDRRLTPPKPEPSPGRPPAFRSRNASAQPAPASRDRRSPAHRLAHSAPDRGTADRPGPGKGTGSAPPCPLRLPHLCGFAKVGRRAAGSERILILTKDALPSANENEDPGPKATGSQTFDGQMKSNPPAPGLHRDHLCKTAKAGQPQLWLFRQRWASPQFPRVFCQQAELRVAENSRQLLRGGRGEQWHLSRLSLPSTDRPNFNVSCPDCQTASRRRSCRCRRRLFSAGAIESPTLASPPPPSSPPRRTCNRSVGCWKRCR